MKKKTIFISLGILVFASIATAAVLFVFPYIPNNPPKADDTGFTAEGIEKVVIANNQFAFDLYNELVKSEDGNILYSPYSISSALAMTYEGTKGKTAEEIKSVFHFPENSILRPNFAAIYNDINRGNKDFELKTGNALWAQYDYSFLKEYTENVEKYYGVKAANVDFVNELEKSRQTINSFIAKQTKNKIEELIPQGTISSITKLIITNAVYFKGTWEYKFDKSDTLDKDFKITPTNIIKTPTLHMEPEFDLNYIDTGDMQILELPYKGEKISMLLLLPTEDTDSINQYLSANRLNEYKTKMTKIELESIELPKFEFEESYSMKEYLIKLGISKAFNEEIADFSGMTGKKNLFIDEVIHKAYIKLDEEGTEATAATGVITNEKNAEPMPRKTFKADHPFIFIIQERQTGNILFVGRIIDPRS